MLLDVRDVTLSFGGMKALNNISLEIEAGEIHGIIGPNGSGKTTLFNVLSGVYQPQSGSIKLDGVDLTQMKSHQIARMGLSRTFQMLRIFRDMTVLENMLVGYHQHIQYGFMPALLGLGSMRRNESLARAEVMEILKFIGLADYADMPAGGMSIGQQRLLALGRAVAMRPRVLMLDEPAAGLSPHNVDRLFETIIALQKRYNLTVVIIEHILKLVMDLCDRVTVLEQGKRIACGTPMAVKDDPRVIEAYLGKEMNDDEIRAALRA